MLSTKLDKEDCELMKKLFRWLVIALLLVVGAYFAAREYLPKLIATLPADGLTLTVPRGASVNRVVNDLAKQGVAPSWQLQIVSRLRGGDMKIRAGQYLFAPPQTLAEIFDALESGAAIQLPITVVEGTTQRELFGLLKKSTEEAKQFRTETVVAPSLWAKAINADTENLEGYLFPDTYFVAPGSSATALLSSMHKRMKQELAQAWEKRAADTPLKTPYEALVLASIIEKETGRDSDRPLVGSVFVNRLRIGMRLQTDPTVIYGLGEKFDGNLRRVDLQTDTPYNSYTRDGLPPTPIAFPGRASLRAAVNPPKSDFLYFVARGDGTSEFSRNLAEHNRAVAKFQLRR
jgi:UPF0755 protein